MRSSSGSKSDPLPSSSSASTTSTLPKSSSTPTRSRAEIKKKKILSPLSFIKGSGRKGDNTPWKPMDEVNKLFFGPYVRLVKLDHPPSLSTKSKLKRNHQRAVIAQNIFKHHRLVIQLNFLTFLEKGYAHFHWQSKNKNYWYNSTPKSRRKE